MVRVIYNGKVLDRQHFRCYRLDADGTNNFFETDQAITDTFNLFLIPNPRNLSSGRITDVHYMMTPTAVETYTLYIAMGAAIDDVTQASWILYESAAARASGVSYRESIDRVFNLLTPGIMFYAIDWTGAPGNTLGFINVRGEVYQ